MSENASHRLTDQELLDQLSTFIFVGSDAVAIALAWTLHYLSLNSDIQTQLREELLATRPSAQADPLTAVDALPFLDAVVRETLRITPPVHGTIRVATEDDVIPLSEPIVLRTGELAHEVHIKKGSYVHIPIEGLNYSKDVWGPDARDFKLVVYLYSALTLLYLPKCVL